VLLKRRQKTGLKSEQLTTELFAPKFRTDFLFRLLFQLDSLVTGLREGEFSLRQRCT